MKQSYIILAALVILSSLCSGDRCCKSIKARDILRIGIRAYIYGYSLMTNEVTRVQMTDPVEGLALMGEFNNVRTFPPASYHGAAAPNSDTLYSIAWIDLDKEPWFYSHPDMGDRFYLFPLYSLWIEGIDDSGARTDGGSAATYALIGPNWKLPLPENITEYVTKTIYCPTRYVVIVGRTYCTGTTEDYDEVHALQDQYLLRPLSIFLQNQNISYNGSANLNSTNTTPPFNLTDSVRNVLNDMNISMFFNMMLERMIDNPPGKEDFLILRKMARIGLIPGKKFDLDNYSRAGQFALHMVPKIAFYLIAAYKSRLGVVRNGWTIATDTSSFGINYIERAAVSLYGWVGNNASDAIYSYADVDSAGATLVGTNQYTIHFAKNETPPVNAFWSITMYDSDLFYVPNDLDKYNINPRDALVYNDDGSLDLYIQYTSPGEDLEANWLPAPEAEFVLMLRMYWPLVTVDEMANGTWLIPPIVKTETSTTQQ